MKQILFSILLIVLFSCNKKFIYQSKIGVSKKNLYSNNLILDSNYKYLLKHNKWRLKIYSERRNKIQNVDDNFFSIKFYNDSMIQCVFREDSVFNLKICESNAYRQIEGATIDSLVSLIFQNDSNLYFTTYNDSIFPPKQYPLFHFSYMHRLKDDILILNIYLNADKPKQTRRFRLLFEKV